MWSRRAALAVALAPRGLTRSALRRLLDEGRVLVDGRPARASQAVKAGQVSLNGLYLNELTGLCRPEELLRLFRMAARMGAETGVPVEAAMISDVPGYTWGTVPAMAQAGIRYFSVAPNYFDRIGDILVQWENKPFYWVGPSGKDKVLGFFVGQLMKKTSGKANPQLANDLFRQELG